MIAINKYDLVSGDKPEILDSAGAALHTSALTGEGIGALRERIVQLATGGAASEPGMLTSMRHHRQY